MRSLSWPIMRAAVPIGQTLPLRPILKHLLGHVRAQNVSQARQSRCLTVEQRVSSVPQQWPVRISTCGGDSCGADACVACTSKLHTRGGGVGRAICGLSQGWSSTMQDVQVVSPLAADPLAMPLNVQNHHK